MFYPLVSAAVLLCLSICLSPLQAAETSTPKQHLTQGAVASP